MIGTGYRIKKLLIPFKIGGKQRRLENDLQIKVNLSFKTSNSVLRKLAEGTNQVTQGMQTTSISGDADYEVSDKLRVNLYYKYIFSTPVSSSPYGNTSFGVSVRFTLAQ